MFNFFKKIKRNIEFKLNQAETKRWRKKMQPLIDYWAASAEEQGGAKIKSEVFIPWQSLNGLKKVTTVDHDKKFFDKLKSGKSRSIKKTSSKGKASNKSKS